jgi:hypothetical protein
MNEDFQSGLVSSGSLARKVGETNPLTLPSILEMQSKLLHELEMVVDVLFERLQPVMGSVPESAAPAKPGLASGGKLLDIVEVNSEVVRRAIARVSQINSNLYL